VHVRSGQCSTLQNRFTSCVPQGKRVLLLFTAIAAAVVAAAVAAAAADVAAERSIQ
jgi:hypothetical protein